MQGAYPELMDSAARVAKVVEAEEKQFDRVLMAEASWSGNCRFEVRLADIASRRLQERQARS